MHPHHQLLHLLAAIADAMLEVCPEHASLDLAASAPLATSLRSQTESLMLLPEVAAAAKSEVQAALEWFEQRELALDAAHDAHRSALRALSHAVEQARRHAQPAPPGTPLLFSPGEVPFSMDPAAGARRNASA